jgi:GNAT superfamily N-acetyltransferase
VAGPLLIRPVAEGDFEDWLPLWAGYNRFYGRFDDTALPEPITRSTWARFFDPDEPVHALVADIDGQLVGLVHYLFHRSTILIEPNCYLQDLFTSEAARGRGVGEALIRAVYDAAKAAGGSVVYWHTHETNATARKLYDRVAANSGFLVYRRRL